MKVKNFLTMVLALSFIFLNPIASFSEAPKFGLDDLNSRHVKDTYADTEFPFKLVWEQKLPGKVQS